MNKQTWGALAIGIMILGCETQESVNVVKENHIVFIATDGGPGGSGGTMTLWVKESNRDIHGGAFKELFTLTAGRGGVGGTGKLGPAGVTQPDGVEGRLEVMDLKEYSFDRTGITADMVTDIDTQSQLYLSDNADPLPPIRVSKFRVAAGQTLEIEGDIRIQAETFLIEKGGRLVLRARGHQNSVIRVGTDPNPLPGSHGGNVFIQAGEFHLGGLIELSGTSGTTGQPGGNGGNLLLQAENLIIEDGAQILANGGDGGNGIDEHE